MFQVPPIVDRSWYYPVRRLEGMDGRFMNVHCSPDSGCQYENDDGLLYAYLSDDAIHALQRHTVAAQLTAQLSDPAAVSALTKDALGALRSERDAACEAGLLRELLHEAVAVRHAKDNCTVLLVRF